MKVVLGLFDRMKVVGGGGAMSQQLGKWSCHRVPRSRTDTVPYKYYKALRSHTQRAYYKVVQRATKFYGVLQSAKELYTD